MDTGLFLHKTQTLGIASKQLTNIVGFPSLLRVAHESAALRWITYNNCNVQSLAIYQLQVFYHNFRRKLIQ